MPIENRFAIVTIRVPLIKFTSEQDMNVWPPGDWPKVIEEGAGDYIKHLGFEVVDSQMEGEVYRQTKYTFYCVWMVMGSMISQYLEFENDPPTVKEIQTALNVIAAAVTKTYEAAGQPMEEPPTDIVLFSFNKVGGRADDAIPKDEGGAKSSTQGGNEVADQEQNSDVRHRKHRKAPLN